MAAAGLTFDFLTPLGVAGGLIYVVFILSAVWWRHPNTALVFAALATAFTLSGFWLIPAVAAPPEVVLLNRKLTLLALWAVAFILRSQKQAAATLQHSEGKLRAVLDGTVDGIITIGEDGTVESYNAACERIFGYTAAEVTGQNVKMLMPDPYQADHDRYIQNYRRTGTRKIIGIGREVQGLRKDGSVFPMDLSVNEAQTDGKRIFTGIVRDITSRKQAEAEREHFIEQLERSNRELDNFAYIASHDLKAPLRVIDNTSRWLEEDLAEHLDDENRENMEMLRNRVRRMEKLLDDLLVYSRIGRQAQDPGQEWLDGGKLVQDAALLSDLPQEFELDVSAALSEIVLPHMPLQQVFANLINNAVKHHDKAAGKISVTMREQGGKHLFSVKDDGPGIDPQFHQRVFKMFTTLQPRDKVEGSGMGLAMVQKTMEHFGEEITLESAPGHGCTFTFSWPVPSSARPQQNQ
ncbi:hypothetical protein RA20_22705 [Leisingera sp. ANG-Vp]|nr:hypothetical protein RA20_22705 [Leisingera sp. ANG-Vp]